MIRGLYIGATGMLLQTRKADAIANNLANVNTNGFKKDEVVEESFGSLLLNRYNDLSQGGSPPPSRWAAGLRRRGPAQRH